MTETLFFKGSVDDVKSERMPMMMLDADNHANVTFETDDVSSFDRLLHPHGHFGANGVHSKP